LVLNVEKIVSAEVHDLQFVAELSNPHHRKFTVLSSFIKNFKVSLPFKKAGTRRKVCIEWIKFHEITSPSIRLQILLQMQVHNVTVVWSTWCKLSAIQLQLPTERRRVLVKVNDTVP